MKNYIDIIFLDIDGVLNSIDSLLSHKHLGNPEILYDIPHPAHISVLNRIIQETEAKVVISSSWRGSWHLFHLNIFLCSLGFRGEIVGYTPRLVGKERGEEIKLFVDLFNSGETINELKIKDFLSYSHEDLPENYVIRNYVILDDDNDMADIIDHLVLIDNEKGLVGTDGDRAIEILRDDLR